MLKALLHFLGYFAFHLQSQVGPARCRTVSSDLGQYVILDLSEINGTRLRLQIEQNKMLLSKNKALTERWSLTEPWNFMKMSLKHYLRKEWKKHNREKGRQGRKENTSRGTSLSKLEG